MAVNDDRPAQPTAKPMARSGRRQPNKRNADPEARTRQFLALMVGVTFSVITLLVVIGGLAGRFDPTLVDAMITALTSAAAGVWVYFFRHGKTGGED
jgi:hypothetical protein